MKSRIVMSHLGLLITAAHSVLLLSVIFISQPSVRINFTMTNSHCNNQKHDCRNNGPHRISRQMDEKSDCNYFMCIFPLFSLPSLLILSSFHSAAWLNVFFVRGVISDKVDHCLLCPDVPIKNLTPQLSVSNHFQWLGNVNCGQCCEWHFHTNYKPQISLDEYSNFPLIIPFVKTPKENNCGVFVSPFWWKHLLSHYICWVGCC